MGLEIAYNPIILQGEMLMKQHSVKLAFAAALLATSALPLAVSSTAMAGPFIISGTDSDDHGGVSSGVNQDGWLFMQKALENIASSAGLTNTAKHVVFLGHSAGSSLGAATSAFNLSTLFGAGWTSSNVDGAANITTFLQGGAAGASIIMLDSGASNVGGGLTAAEDAALAAEAAAINTFVGLGGGLFSLGNAYTWLSALLPALTFTQHGGGGVGTPLVLTADGNAAFPGLTDADLSTGPWHVDFANTGTLPILADDTAGLHVILGAQGGSITDPDDPTGVPEPMTMGLLGAGLAGLGLLRRRQANRS